MWYCAEEQGSCEAWELIYFTSHKAQRVWSPPKAATGKAPLILASRSVDRWLKFGKRCWDEQLACCWGSWSSAWRCCGLYWICSWSVAQQHFTGVQGEAQLCAAEPALLLFDFKRGLVVITFKISTSVVAGWFSPRNFATMESKQHQG